MKKSISALALAGTRLRVQWPVVLWAITWLKNQPSAQLLKNGRKHSRPISNHAFTAPGSRELFLLPVLRVPLHLCGKLLAGIRITCVIFCPSL